MQISVLARVLCGQCRARRGIGGAGGVPLSRVGPTQAVVIGDGIVNADSLFMVHAVAVVAGLVAVGYTLTVEGMVRFTLYLSVTCAIGVGIRQVDAQLSVVVDDTGGPVSRAILVLPPTPHHLS